MKHPVELTNPDQWNEVIKESERIPVLLFKFSPICSLSHYAENEFFSFFRKYPGQLKFFTINVIAGRLISKQAAADLGVKHQSPQILLISNGKCLWHESHSAITTNNIKSNIDFLI